MLRRLQACTSQVRLPQDEIDVLDALAKRTTKILRLQELNQYGAALSATPTTILRTTMQEIASCNGSTVAKAIARSIVTTIVVDGTTATDEAIAVLAAIFQENNKQLSQLVVKSADVATKLFTILSKKAGRKKSISHPHSLQKVIVDATMFDVKQVTNLLETAPMGIEEVVVCGASCEVDINDMEAYHIARSKSNIKLSQDAKAADRDVLYEQSITAFKSPLAPTSYVPVRDCEDLAEDQMAFGFGVRKYIPVTTEGLRHSLVVKGFMDLNLGTANSAAPGPVDDKLVTLDIEEEPPGLLSVQCMACFLDHVATDDDTTAAQKETQPSCHVPPHHFSFLLTLKTTVDGDENKYIALLAQLLQLSIYYNIPALKRLARSGLVINIGSPPPSVALPHDLEREDVTIVELDWAEAEWAYKGESKMHKNWSSAPDLISFDGERLKLGSDHASKQGHGDEVEVLPREEFGETCGQFYFEFALLGDNSGQETHYIGVRNVDDELCGQKEFEMFGDEDPTRVGVLVTVTEEEQCTFNFYVDGEHNSRFDLDELQGPCRFSLSFYPGYCTTTIMTDLFQFEEE